ncbi:MULTISPECIES: phospholipase D family protein [unclassified Agarivorans]|uniref:phospholipase D family protein n=1 Tax=unclassified Agarivorans TaxID=2636026 RepID=UPI003D7EB8CC
MDATKFLVKLIIMAFAGLVFFGCAQRPDPALIAQYKQASYALIAPDELSNKQSIMQLQSYQPGKNGIAILPDGVSALAARIALIEKAQLSIDAQYYMIKEDLTGAIFLGHLLKAAERGVRVRLLMDDINTNNYDDMLKAITMHPNIEVRIFNPFYNRRFRVTNMLGDFQRLNSRMHNKSLTIDGLISVVGGRNIGDEYFSARDDLDFADIDAMAFGPVVQQVSQAFDLYWNDRRSYPMEALNLKSVDQDAQLRRLEQQLFSQSLKPLLQAHTRYQQLISNHSLRDVLYWCDAELFVDHPDKNPDFAQDVASNLAQVLGRAKQTILLSSPYFVPGVAGSQGLSAIAKSGVDVSVITNSLAATDVAAVHAGYKNYRQQLLEANVFIYEIKPDAKQRQRLAFFGKGASRASLHSKLFVIDQEKLFIGSFNWDPRSINLNTEMGLLLSCPNLADKVTQQIRDNLDYKSYQVQLDSNHRLRWREKLRNQTEIIYSQEPKATLWRKFQAWLVGLLPLEDQL